MTGEEEPSSEIRLPDDEDDVVELAGAKTDEEKNLAVTQARMIGDLPDK